MLASFCFNRIELAQMLNAWCVFQVRLLKLVMESSANITNCRRTVSELLCITYITSCPVCVCACFSLKGAGFPLHLLPQCVPSGGVAGLTRSAWHGIPAGTPVGAALGDFQCSVYSCMSARTDAGETGSAVTPLLTGSHLQQKYCPPTVHTL